MNTIDHEKIDNVGHDDFERAFDEVREALEQQLPGRPADVLAGFAEVLVVLAQERSPNARASLLVVMALDLLEIDERPSVSLFDHAKHLRTAAVALETEGLREQARMRGASWMEKVRELDREEGVKLAGEADHAPA